MEIRWSVDGTPYIDECTGRRLAILLKNAGYDVVFVGDWKPSASDEECP